MSPVVPQSPLPSAVSAREFSALFDAALDSVVGIDADGIVTAWNRQAEVLFGWRRDEATGQDLATLIIPAALRERHRAGIAHYLESGVGPALNSRIEVSAVNKAGQEFPVELSIIPLEGGSRPIFYGFLRDISLQKQLLEQAARAQTRDKMLFEISRLATETGEFDVLLRRSLEIVCTYTGSACGHIYIPDLADNPTVFRATDIWHLQSEALAPVRINDTAATLKIGEGLPGRIWQSGQAEWIPDLSDHPGFLRAREFAGLGLRSGFGFPVMRGGVPMAILEFFSRQLRQRDDELLATIARIGSHLGRVIERHRAHEQTHLLARELSHRVGNLMSVVSAVFQRSIRHSVSVDDVEVKFSQRLQALKSVQNRLLETDWEGTDLRQLVEDVVAPYCSLGDGTCNLIGDDVRLDASQSMTLSLVFHELAVNAAKYGALSVSEGKLDLSWNVSASDTATKLVVIWREYNGPPMSTPGRDGFGTELITRLLVKGMRGRVDADYAPAGLTMKLQFPI